MLCLSCVSTSSKKELRDEIVGLDGMAVEFIKTQWGEPDSKRSAAGGQSLTYEGVFIKDEDLFTGENADRFCEVKLNVDAEGLVSDWSYDACEFVNKGTKEQVAEGKTSDEESSDGELEEGREPSVDAAAQDDKLEMLPLTP